MTIEERIEKMEQDLKEMKQELENKENKQQKSLSDYRYYKEPNEHENYKLINTSDKIETLPWHDFNFDIVQFEKGNVYSIGTPDELLEREIKKRQLWFELEKHLKEKGCLATDEDWKDKNKYKYHISYSYNSETVIFDGNLAVRKNTIYSTNKEILKNYMNTLTEEDIKIMFDVE